MRPDDKTAVEAPAKPERARDGGRAAEVDLDLLPGLLGYNLRRAQLADFQGFSEVMADWKISPGQFGVLVIIAANSGLNQTNLAGALEIDRSTMVAVLDGLEARALVVRKPSPRDRRSYALELTREGARILGEIRPVLDAHERHLTAPLGDTDRATLIRLLRRVNGF